MLPGIIKPLVWSVNTSIVNAAWIELLEEIVGPLDLRPQDLARSFGYRAYFDATTFGTVFERLGMPHDSIELMLGLPKGAETPRFTMSGAAMRHLPRMLAVGRRTLARGRWARAELREMERRHAELAAVDPAGLDDAALLGRIDEITALARRAAYANIVIPMVLLGYERTLWWQVRAAGIDPATIDPAATRGDRAGCDPVAELDALRGAVDELPEASRAALAAGGAAALDTDPALTPLRRAIDRFLDRFGHLSGSSNDFSRPVWREDRDAVVDLVLAHRPRTAGNGWVDAGAVEARLPRLQRPAFRLLWRRSGAFVVYRQAVGAAWSRSYGLFRGTFLALGSRLVARGILGRPDDVFFLSLEEVQGLTAGDPAELPGVGTAGGSPGMPGLLPSADEVRARVARRRREVEEAAELVVPEVVYGDDFVPRRRGEEPAAALDGVPASRGVARGRARVVRGTEDFARVATGDVIVIPFSDVSWTPLFARAAGVVAEATGGILSHAAIVAREYGIPCVVGVTGACDAIPDGVPVVVDGTAGSVLVEAGGSS
jgi:pyruvate,water dikinase